MRVAVRVKPGSSREKIILEGQKLVVWLMSRPVEGKANVELLKLLKRTFGDARLISGGKSKRKTIEVPQESVDEVAEALQS